MAVFYGVAVVWHCRCGASDYHPSLSTARAAYRQHLKRTGHEEE